MIGAPPLKRLPIILSVLYWLVVAVVLRLGYLGDVEIHQTKPTAGGSSVAFDVTAVFAITVVVYAVACAIWWALSKLNRRAV